MQLEQLLRLIAGVFVTATVALAVFVHPYFLWATLFVGLNLLGSGVINWCPMMSILKAFGVRGCGSAPAAPAR